MKQIKKTFLFRSIMILGTLLGAHSAFAATAADTCKTGQQLPNLVPNLLKGVDATGSSFDVTKVTKNDTVCIDVPVALVHGNKIVWDIDTPVTTDGSPMDKVGVVSAALRHMYMMAWANWGFVNNYNKMHKDDDGFVPLKHEDYHIYGVIHGSAVKWALSDAWWQAQTDRDGDQLYPNGNPVKDWIEKLKNTAAFTHVDIQLETCGVTLYGGGYKHNNAEDDVYPGIKVNQGAFGRFQALHQAGYQLMQEGWVDNDNAYLIKSANN